MSGEVIGDQMVPLGREIATGAHWGYGVFLGRQSSSKGICALSGFDLSVSVDCTE